MKYVLPMLGACLLLSTGSLPATAQNNDMQEAQPGFETSRAVTTRATVQAIDHQRRTVTLKDQSGKVFTVKVGEEARNFKNVHKGDQVTIRRQEELALALRKSNEPATTSETETMMRAPAGEKPGGTAIRTTQLTATVENIDRQNREVTLRGPEGNTRTLKVGRDVAAFDRLQKGDQVVATYTEAFSVKVTKPKD